MRPIVFASCLLAFVIAQEDEYKMTVESTYESREGYASRGRKFFTVSSYNASWVEAEEACLSKNMHLATVRNKKQNDALQLMMDKHGISLPMWIGASDRASEGRWRWESDGSDLDYTAWLSGEPNNYEGNEDCLCMINHGPAWFHGRWWDLNCASQYRFACEGFRALRK